MSISIKTGLPTKAGSHRVSYLLPLTKSATPCITEANARLRLDSHNILFHILAMQLSLRPDIENMVRERLSSGIDANDLMLAALQATSDHNSIRDAVEIGWRQAEQKDFVEATPDSVISRADNN